VCVVCVCVVCVWYVCVVCVCGVCVVCVPLTSPNVLFKCYPKYYYSALGITNHATEVRDIQTSHDSICPLFELRILHENRRDEKKINEL